MHYVYVKDLVKGTIQTASSKLVSGDYILAGPKPEKFADVTKAAYKALGKTGIPRNLPLWIAYPAAYVLEVAGVVTGWKPPLYPSRIKTMLSSYSYSISKAKKEIGYHPSTSLQGGFSQTARWYVENGKL